MGLEEFLIQMHNISVVIAILFNIIAFIIGIGPDNRGYFYVRHNVYLCQITKVFCLTEKMEKKKNI